MGRPIWTEITRTVGEVPSRWETSYQCKKLELNALINRDGRWGHDKFRDTNTRRELREFEMAVLSKLGFFGAVTAVVPERARVWSLLKLLVFVITLLNIKNWPLLWHVSKVASFPRL